MWEEPGAGTEFNNATSHLNYADTQNDSQN